MYGEEVYDYRRGRVDIDRLLDAGEAFGGYDVICLWHQYPRLGVDARSQWDFFRGFPRRPRGPRGRAAATKGRASDAAVQAVGRAGPYVARRHRQNAGAFAAETDADGFFLDTMSDVPPQFRIEADRVRPGCVFCTELVPDNAQALELLTGSWRQTAPAPIRRRCCGMCSPSTAATTSRAGPSTRAGRYAQKAVMNGSGLVIWQDVFGAWLPYTDEQKAAVKRWKRIWLENKAYFLSQTALPLWPALQPDLIVNAFMTDDKTSAVFTVYNFSGGEISGAWFRHGFGRAVSAEELWAARRYTPKTAPSAAVWRRARQPSSRSCRPTESDKKYVKEIAVMPKSICWPAAAPSWTVCRGTTSRCPTVCNICSSAPAHSGLWTTGILPRSPATSVRRSTTAGARTAANTAFRGYLAGPDYLSRVFGALGYAHTYAGRSDIRRVPDAFARRVAQTVDGGLPVLAVTNLHDIPGWESDVVPTASSSATTTAGARSS